MHDQFDGKYCMRVSKLQFDRRKRTHALYARIDENILRFVPIWKTIKPDILRSLKVYKRSKELLYGIQEEHIHDRPGNGK